MFVDVYGIPSFHHNACLLASIPCKNASEVMRIYAEEIEFYKNCGIEVTHCEVRVNN